MISLTGELDSRNIWYRQGRLLIHKSFMLKYIYVYMTKVRRNISIDAEIDGQMRKVVENKYHNSKSFSTYIEYLFDEVHNVDIDIEKIRVEEAMAAKEKWLSEYRKEISTSECIACSNRETRCVFFCDDCKTDFEAHYWAKFCPFCSSTNVKLGNVQNKDKFQYKIIEALNHVAVFRIQGLLDEGKTKEEIASELNITLDAFYDLRIKEMWDKGVQDTKKIAKDLHLRKKKVEEAIEDLKDGGLGHYQYLMMAG